MNTPAAGPFDTIAAMVFVLDADGVITSVNEAATTALGRSRADLQGMRFDELAPAGGRGVNMFRTGAGAALCALVAASSPGRDGSTTVTALAAPQVADPAQDAKLAALGELAHHVVHELNQPLSVIRMAIGTARRKLAVDGVDADFIDAKLERIDTQCVRAASIVETMRVFVPRNRALRIALDVNRAVENAVGMTAPKFRKLNAEVRTTLGEARWVLGNEMQVEPALLCVLGEVHDRIAAAGQDSAAAIDVRTCPVGGDTVEIVVSDAAGRAQASATPAAGIALGMGLSMARELAGELGGHLETEPHETGMTYRFSLPVTEEPQQ